MIRLPAVRAFTLLAAAFTAACSAYIPPTERNPLEPSEEAALSARSAILVQRPLPEFEIYKTSDQLLQMATAPFGLAAIWGTFAGVTAAIDHRSDPFVTANHLADPAYGVAVELGRYFGPRFGVVFAGVTPEIVETSDPKELAQSLKGRADYALDIRTVYWGLTTSPLVPTYRFAYRGSMRVIDLRSGATLASGQCKYWPESAEAAKLADLTDANAALLKQKIASATDACAAQFTDIILNRPEAPPPGRKPTASVPKEVSPAEQ